MFKTIASFIGMFILASSVSGQSSSEVLQKWDASNKFKNNLSLHCARGCKATKKYFNTSKVLNVKIIKNSQKFFSSIQLSFFSTGKIIKGTKYKIKISLYSDQPGQLKVVAMQRKKPWDALGKKSHVKVNLQPNQKKDIVIEFEAKKDFEKVRIPGLFLGKLPSGTELNIKSVSFEKITSL